MHSKINILYRFSLYTKLPKKYQPKIASSWFERLFSQSQSSPTYVLLQQLFDYLHNSELFMKEFPYMQNTQRISQNNMLTHVSLLRSRIAAESELPRSQIQKFNYNIQNTFFPEYAAFINPHIPTSNFKSHYAESYMKKLEIFSEDINQYEFAIASNRVLSPPQYAPLFKKLVYQNRLNIQNHELMKYCKYYCAHVDIEQAQKKYLNNLNWEDMVSYKVKWGFEQGKFLGQIDRP